jgi:hypothetical protein
MTISKFNIKKKNHTQIYLFTTFWNLEFIFLVFSTPNSKYIFLHHFGIWNLFFGISIPNSKYIFLQLFGIWNLNFGIYLWFRKVNRHALLL